MIRPIDALGAALSLAWTATAAHGQPAPPPAPRWHLDGASTRCVLTRRLEGTPGAATFILRTIPGSGRYDLMLAGSDLRRELRPGRQVSVAFAPGGSRHERRLARIDLPGDLGDAVAIAPLGGPFASEFARASTIEVSGEGGQALGSWTIPVAERAADALAACEAEKQVDWGADPAGFEPGAMPPRRIGDSYEWLTARDLGMLDVLASTEVAAVFRLEVGADGRATRCTLLESGGSMVVGPNACRSLVHRARYEPARDPRGNPVRSVDIYSVAARAELDFRPIG
jgi:hypothetical protein